MQILMQEVEELRMSRELGMHQLLWERKHMPTSHSLNPREEQTAVNDIAAALTQQQKGVPFLSIWVSSKWSSEGQEECGRTSSETLKFSLGQGKPLAASQPPQGVTEAPLLPGSIAQKVERCLQKVER